MIEYIQGILTTGELTAGEYIQGILTTGELTAGEYIQGILTTGELTAGEYIQGILPILQGLIESVLARSTRLCTGWLALARSWPATL
jgi:hypothetical protein